MVLDFPGFGLKMAVQEQNFGFENMGFNPFVMCGSQDWVMGTADGLYFQEQRKKIHQVFDSWDDQASPSPLPMEFLQSLSSDLQNQRLEMDLLLWLEVKIYFYVKEIMKWKIFLFLKEIKVLQLKSSL